jgi:hypothetical protein
LRLTTDVMCVWCLVVALLKLEDLPVERPDLVGIRANREFLVWLDCLGEQPSDAALFSLEFR